MDIIPAAKFQESLSRVTVSIHCSYLKNQILNAINQVLPSLVASKLFMSDVDTEINNDILDRMDLGNAVLILKPKDLRYKDAIDLLGIKYKSGKIYIMPHKSIRVELVLVCLVLKSDDTEETIITTFNDFVEKTLDNFDAILEKASDFRLKCLEMEKTLSMSVPFSEKNQSHRIMQLISEISDDDPQMIYFHIMMQILKMTKSDTGAFGIYSADSEELKIFVVGDSLKEIAEVIPVKEESFLKDIIHLNNSIIIQSNDIKKNQKNILRTILKGYNKALQTVMICINLISMSKTIKAVVILANKSAGGIFQRPDIECVSNILLYACPIIHMANSLQLERMERNRTQKLLLVAKSLFSRMDNFDDLIFNIMREAQNLTTAERCSLFLLDNERNELVSKVLDGVVQVNGTKGYQEIRFPLETGIAGLVATTGKMLNIANAYDHPAFFRGVDEITGFKTKSILCFPIKNDRGRVVGVAQLCNKFNFPYFTKFDEDLAAAFSVFCHISIINSLIYKKIEDAQQRSVLANKVMTSHYGAKAKISTNLVEKITHSNIVRSEEILINATSLAALPKNVPENDTIMFCLSMFDRMNLLNRWRIHRRTLAMFILTAKRGYRDVAYHNWYHALTVGHFIFASYMTFDLTKYLHEIENFVLLVAGFCHDIDHRGTNNSFQTKSKSVLASLYSSEESMLEHHHFAQTVCIIQTESCNIFESMDHKEYLKALDLLRYIILATDLVHHFRKKPELDGLVVREYNIDSTKDRSLLLCLLITSADLSDQSKEWQYSCLSSKAIYKEFLNQGDMEKELGNTPLEHMDRNKAIIPLLQISFIEGVIEPLYVLLSTIFSGAKHLLNTVRTNNKNWKKLHDLVKADKITGLNDTIFTYIESNTII